MEGALIFVLATLTKAWEPLSVAFCLSADGVHEFSFAVVLVLCECTKMVVACMLLLRNECRGLGPGRPRVRWMLSIDVARSYGVPAFFLAITNQMLGFAVPLLDPVLYQVIFKVVSVLSTGLLTQLVLRQALTVVQWCAIGLLLLGFWLAQPNAATMGSKTHILGLLGTLLGAISFSVQGVWFAWAVRKAPEQDTLEQTVALGAWGALANLLFLFTLHWEWLLSHGPFYAFSWRVWLVVVSIAVTDLIMAVFFKFLGTNAYSFSRVAAMLVSTLLAVFIFDRHVSASFALGATLVTLSGWLYQRHEAGSPESETEPLRQAEEDRQKVLDDSEHVV